MFDFDEVMQSVSSLPLRCSRDYRSLHIRSSGISFETTQKMRYLGSFDYDQSNRAGLLNPILNPKDLLGILQDKIHRLVPTLQLSSNLSSSIELHNYLLILQIAQFDDRFLGDPDGEAQICHIYLQIIPNYKMMERQHRSTGRSSDTIASFLLKTYEILEHPENRKIICWDKDDIGFIVIDVVSFTREILPKYFRHSNFSSFVRQLNMYDFHKVKQDNEMLVFKNPLFCRGEQQKLRFIKRKAAKKITGLHKRFYNHDRPQHEKTMTAYKWLKKAMESEINHSCIFLEKSIELITENNESISHKQQRIEQINTTQDQIQKLDSLYQFREECQLQVNKTIRWLDQYIEIFKRKVKTLGNYNLQLLQSKKDEVANRPSEDIKSLAQIS